MMAPHVDGHMIGGFFYILWGLTAFVLPSMWALMKTRTGPHIFKVRNSKRSNSESYLESEAHAKLDEHLKRYTWLPQPCCSPRFPYEPLLKIIVPTIGIIIEVFLFVETPPNAKAHVVFIKHPFHIWNDDGTIDTYGIKKPYHATIYGAVLMSGVVDIIAMLIDIPRQTSPIFISIAFMVEAILFFFHIKGQSVIEGHIHSVLTTIVLVCIILSLVRVFNPAKFVINLGLGSSVIVLGLWFFQTGYIRNYNHQYKLISELNNTMTMSLESNEMVHMFQWYITACFAWTVIGVAGSMFIVWMVLLCIHRGLQRCHGRLSCGCSKWIKGEFVPLLAQVRGYKKVVQSNFHDEEKENLIVSCDANVEPETFQMSMKTSGAKTSEVVEC